VLNNKINGKDVEYFGTSYTLRYLYESTLSNFNKLSIEEKKNLCYKFDEEFSERFEMPRAEIRFEDKEYSLERNVIYFGKIEKVNSGLEFMFRYFFNKRQQFQKECVFCNDGSSFGDEFLLIKDGYTRTPITKKSKYVPYSKGLKNYLCNYIKVDALIFAFDQCDTIIKLSDVKRAVQNMGFVDMYKLIKTVKSMDLTKKEITSASEKIAMDDKFSSRGLKVYKRSIEEEKFLTYLHDVIEGKISDVDSRIVFLFFHKNIWNSLDIDRKKLVVSTVNERIVEMLGCKKIKEVEYSKGDNSYQFGDSDKVYVGDINKESGEAILQRLVYEYSFNKNYENIFLLDEGYCEAMLDEVEKCKRIFKESGDYLKLKDYHFIKCVRKTSLNFLENAYRYISNNLYVDGKKIGMAISKDEFVVDIFKKSRRRG